MHNKKIKILMGCAIALLLLLILFAYVYSNQFKIDERSSKKTLKSEFEIKEEMQKNVKNNMFSIRINSEIVLSTFNDKADLYLRNLKENKNDMYVKIVSNDTKKEIYTSKILKPGKGVKKAKLKNLPKKGKNTYTASFYLLEKGKESSSIDYEITIEVKGNDHMEKEGG